MKDRAGRGGSSSIPTGNNGAAGQECRLQEVGSGREGTCFEAAMPKGTKRILSWMSGGGSEAHGCVWGSRAVFFGRGRFTLRWRRRGWWVNLGQQCLCLTRKQEQKDTRVCSRSVFQRENRLAASCTFFSRTNCYRRSFIFVRKKPPKKQQPCTQKHREVHC